MPLKLNLGLKKILIGFSCFILIFWILPNPVSGQPTDRRHALQQKFIINRYLTGNPTKSIAATHEVDSIFKIVQSGWERFITDSLKNRTIYSVKALKNLDAYSYYWTLLSLSSMKISPEASAYLTGKYMLPSLQADLQLIHKDPSPANLGLLWPGAVFNTFSSALSSYQSGYVDINQLSMTFDELIGLRDMYGRLDSSDRERGWRMINQVERDFKYELASKKALVYRDLELAFTEFCAGLSTDSIYHDQAVNIGRALMDELTARHQPARALAALDMLSLYLSDDELDRDTLAKWYSTVDAHKGPNTFSKRMAKLSGKIVVPTGATINLPSSWKLLNADADMQHRISKAKYILLDFWYAECIPCIAEMPQLNKLYDELKNNKDIVFISVNGVDTSFQKAQDAIKKLDIRFPVFQDEVAPSLKKQLNVSGYPFKCVILQNGEVLGRPGNIDPITVATFRSFVNSL